MKGNGAGFVPPRCILRAMENFNCCHLKLNWSCDIPRHAPVSSHDREDTGAWRGGHRAPGSVGGRGMGLLPPLSTRGVHNVIIHPDSCAQKVQVYMYRGWGKFSHLGVYALLDGGVVYRH